MNSTTRIIAVVALAWVCGCATTPPGPGESVSKIRAGMKEAEVRELLRPFTLATGTSRGGALRRVYFQISENEQIWVDLSGYNTGYAVVTRVGKIEPMQSWKKSFSGIDNRMPVRPEPGRTPGDNGNPEPSTDH